MTQRMLMVTSCRALRRCVLWCLAVVLIGCASPGSLTQAARTGRAPLPGDAQYISMGISQDKAYFDEKVERAQAKFGLFRGSSWVEFKGYSAPFMYLGMESYPAVSVRWKLKDGRAFVLEDIDVNAHVLRYFETHQLLLQHQREGRPRHFMGDFVPALVIEVHEDQVRLKWLLHNNLTPPDKRMGPDGGTLPWKVVKEEHLIATVSASMTSGIDFDSRDPSPR